jgi:tetratricopeptide (TPR) repeat protein
MVGIMTIAATELFFCYQKMLFGRDVLSAWFDRHVGHPHAVLAASKFEYDWDFAGGEAEYKKAIALDPSDATAHQWFSLDLSSIGRTQEATDEANRAYQLDPLSPVMRITQVVSYNAARRFDQAVEIGKTIVADNPTFGHVHIVMATAYWGQHKFPQAIHELQTGAQLEADKNLGEVAAALDDGFQSGGWPSALRKAIAVSLAQRKAKRGYVSPYSIAALYAEIGAKDDAFQWLDTAYEEHDPGMLALRTDFSVDVLRSDPPFRDTGAQGRPSAVTGNHVVPPIEPVQRFSNSRRYREPLQSHVLTAVPTYEKPFWYRRIRLHRNDARFRFDPDESFAIAMLPPLRFAKNR